MRERRTIDPDLVHTMHDTLIHRGPDGARFNFRSGFSLGHRRLSIIYLVSGKQPLHDDDKTAVVTYNGEI